MGWGDGDEGVWRKGCCYLVCGGLNVGCFVVCFCFLNFVFFLVLVLMFMFLVCVVVCGVFVEYMFCEWYEVDGLLVEDFGSVVLDDVGYFWVGSLSGLVCFDGMVFEVGKLLLVV